MANGRMSLLDRIGNRLGQAGRGLGGLLSAAGSAYAPPDLELTPQQNIGLLASRLRDMTVSPTGQRPNETPAFLQNVRNVNARRGLLDAITNDTGLDENERRLLLSLPPAQQAEFLQNRLESKFAPGASNLPASVQEYTFRQSLTPQQQSIFDFILRAPTTYDTGATLGVRGPGGMPVPGLEIAREIPPGESPEEQAEVAQAVADVDIETARGVAQAQQDVERSPDSLERQDNFRTKKVTFNQNIVDIDYMIQKAEELLELPGFDMAFGLSSMFTGGPLDIGEGTTARNAIQTFQDVTFVEMIGRMRRQSASGGAVGAVSEKEGERFENMLGDLRSSTNEETARANLRRIIRELQQSKTNLELGLKTEFPSLSASEGLQIDGFRATLGGVGAFDNVPELTRTQRLKLENGEELSDEEYENLSPEVLEQIISIQRRM